jgi:hypothetical protein
MHPESGYSQHRTAALVAPTLAAGLALHSTRPSVPGGTPGSATGRRATGSCAPCALRSASWSRKLGAPSLLATAKRALAWFDSFEDTSYYWGLAQSLVDDLRAAIKAEEQS